MNRVNDLYKKHAKTGGNAKRDAPPPPTDSAYPIRKERRPPLILEAWASHQQRKLCFSLATRVPCNNCAPPLHTSRLACAACLVRDSRHDVSLSRPVPIPLAAPCVSRFALWMIRGVICKACCCENGCGGTDGGCGCVCSCRFVCVRLAGPCDGVGSPWRRIPWARHH